MNFFDFLFIVPLLWGAYTGFVKGLVIELASFVALVLGVWGGLKFSYLSSAYLSKFFDISDNIMPLISFSITFITIVILVFILAKLLQGVLKKAALGIFNKILGLAFGVLKFAFIISIVLNLLNVFNKEVEFIKPEQKQSSLLYNSIEKLGQMIIPGIKELKLNSALSTDENGLNE
ncbi:MAG: CvpA family protein [Flavobacteriales bacterium]|nr:CvpA family protein [Flavobacteriales bacterium]